MSFQACDQAINFKVAKEKWIFKTGKHLKNQHKFQSTHSIACAFRDCIWSLFCRLEKEDNELLFFQFHPLILYVQINKTRL